MPKLLEIQDLKTYFFTHDGIVKAVDGISYELAEGETLGIVGESGCGKSVSALSIMGLVASPPGRIVDGSITFEGEDLVNMDIKRLRDIRGNRISMVFQEPMTSLNPVLTVERQLTESLELHQDMSKDEAREHAAELLEKVGIPDSKRRLKDYPHQFSGGMRQRVMIAMALSCNPKLIIADEPTTALDVTIQAQILDLMSSLSEEFGTSMIIITHNLGVVARYAKRVIVMYAGKIVESGTSEEIFHNPQHPYTVGLLKSVPRLDEKAGTKLDPIQWLPPDLSGELTCQFCGSLDPVLTDVSPGHLSAKCSNDKNCAGWFPREATSESTGSE